MLAASSYSEATLLLAHFILHLIFLAPLMANRKFWHSFFIITPILAVIMLYTTGIRSIYNDSTIGLMFCTIIAIYILESNKKRAIITSLPIFILLPLFREIGFILAMIAALMIILKEINGSKQSIQYHFILYILIFVAPIISNFIWANYFKATHNFFGRTEHSFSNLWLLIKSFNEQNQLLVLHYLKFLFKFLIQEGSLVTLTLIGISWYAVRRRSREYIQEYKFYFKSALIFFVTFCLWRLYLYFFTFSYVEAIKAASLIRYLGCYCLIFAVIAAVYIKKWLSEYDLKSKELAALLLVFTTSLLIVINKTTRIETNVSYSQREFILNAKNTSLLIKQGIKPQFDFINKKELFSCFWLNYEMSPYLSTEEFKKCVAAPINYDPEHKVLFQNLKHEYLEECIHNKENCKVKYYPFNNKVEIYFD